jgi:hypothetical protein
MRLLPHPPHSHSMGPETSLLGFLVYLWLIQGADDKLGQFLKVPKREIFDRSDFPDFYIIKSLCGGDFGVKIKFFTKIIRGSFGGAKFLTRMLSVFLRRIFFLSLGKKNFFSRKLLRPFVSVNRVKNFRCFMYFKNYQKN